MSDMMTRAEYLRDKYADEIAEDRQARRKKRYSCKGFAAWDGPCGASDCESCNPGNSLETDEDEDEDEEPSRKQRKTVRARKARFVGRPGEIRVGDKVSVTSWFTYKVGGARTGYHHWYRRVEKGPAWSE